MSIFQGLGKWRELPQVLNGSVRRALVAAVVLCVLPNPSALTSDLLRLERDQLI